MSNFNLDIESGLLVSIQNFSSNAIFKVDFNIGNGKELLVKSECSGKYKKK